MVSSACQPCSSILVTLPTVTSATRTRELGCRLVTLGSCAWIVNEPGPPPAVPGSGSVFRPRQPPQPDNTADTTTTTTPAATLRRPRALILHLRAEPSFLASRRPDWLARPRRPAAPVTRRQTARRQAIAAVCSPGASSPSYKSPRWAEQRHRRAG